MVVAVFTRVTPSENDNRHRDYSNAMGNKQSPTYMFNSRCFQCHTEAHGISGKSFEIFYDCSLFLASS